MQNLKISFKVLCSVAFTLLALSAVDVLWGPQNVAHIELETGSVAVQVSADKTAEVDVDVVLF